MLFKQCPLSGTQWLVCPMGFFPRVPGIPRVTAAVTVSASLNSGPDIHGHQLAYTHQLLNDTQRCQLVHCNRYKQNGS